MSKLSLSKYKTFGHQMLGNKLLEVKLILIFLFHRKINFTLKKYNTFILYTIVNEVILIRLMHLGISFFLGKLLRRTKYLNGKIEVFKTGSNCQKVKSQN